MTTIKIQVLEGGKLPTKGSEQAACFDVYAREATIVYCDSSIQSFTLGVNDNVKQRLIDLTESAYPTIYYIAYKVGFKTEIPIGYEAECVARSSIRNTCLSLCNGKGIIDSDYRGEWEFSFRVDKNLLQDMPVYEIGERVGQFKIIKSEPTRLQQELDLTETERGEGGHGSTGK